MRISIAMAAWHATGTGCSLDQRTCTWLGKGCSSQLMPRSQLQTASCSQPCRTHHMGIHPDKFGLPGPDASVAFCTPPCSPLHLRPRLSGAPEEDDGAGAHRLAWRQIAACPSWCTVKRQWDSVQSEEHLRSTSASKGGSCRQCVGYQWTVVH